MITRELLEAAVHKKIIQQNQVVPLLDFIQAQQSDIKPQTGSENQGEPLRFIRSFGDIFISLGVVLLVIAINMLPLSGYLYFIPVLGFVVMSEWLVRVRRLVLPGIAILIAILYFVNKAIGFDHDNATIIGLGILSFTSLVFYLRYRMPFSLLPLAASLVAIAIIQIGVELIEYPVIFAGLGLIVFVVAMGFDVRDTERKTHLSDSAFWLHLLASPLIVHGVMISMLFSNHEWLKPINGEFFIVLFFAIFLFIALLLDRRAILVSTQIYMIYALTQILQGQFDSAQNIMIYVLLLLGFVVIFFGTYWYKTRNLIFGFLSASVIGRYVPSFDQIDGK